MNIIMLGAQGSGKGTQAKLLSEAKDIPHISTGDIFRENLKNQTELGKTAQEYMNKGALVPDDLTVALVKDRLKNDDCKNGYILDGFPRNLFQAEELEKFSEVDLAINIELPDNVAIRRISSRRSCRKCGAVYSVLLQDLETDGKCKKCGGELYIREDDTPASINKRLMIYHEATKPLEEYYLKKGVLANINGDRKIEEIQKEIEKILES